MNGTILDTKFLLPHLISRALGKVLVVGHPVVGVGRSVVLRLVVDVGRVAEVGLRGCQGDHCDPENESNCLKKKNFRLQ